MTRLIESEAVISLHRGVADPARWSSFLEDVRRRCGADRALLALSVGTEAPLTWRSGGEPRPGDPTPSHWGVDALRRDRVYSLEELDEERGGDGYGRVVRMADPNVWNAWLLIVRDASDFAAGDGALLSALAPHMNAAFTNFATLEDARQRLAAADILLARAGISWRIVSDAAPAAQTGALILPIIARDAELTAAVTRAPVEPSPAQARCLQDLWGLSTNEARLALAIANGESLADAAESLSLTVETVRHYSKRIYAKTGARGLADLARMVLTSVAVLA